MAECKKEQVEGRRKEGGDNMKTNQEEKTPSVAWKVQYVSQTEINVQKPLYEKHPPDQNKREGLETFQTSPEGT